MTDAPGGATPGSARPDHPTTINEAGAVSFVVDGTDSFAVPGPVDAPPVEDVPSPAISRSRLLATVGAVAAGLTFVIAVGSGGGTGASDASVRSGPSDEGTDAGFALPLWDDGDDAAPAVVPLEPTDDETLRVLAERAPLGDADAPFADGLDEEGVLGDDGELDDGSFPADPDLLDDDGSSDDDFSDDDFDGDDFDGDDFSDDDFYGDDDDLPAYTPPRRVTPSRPRTITTVPRPRATTPTTTTTTTATTATTIAPSTTTSTTATSETTTTSTPSTTTDPATTSSSTTSPATTTPVPGPAWVAADGGLPGCPASLRVWSQPDRLVAVAGDRLYQRTAGDWTALGGPVSGSATMWAYAPGTVPTSFWVGGDAGVFGTVDAGATYQPLPSLPDVRSLGALANGTLLAVTSTEQLHRWDPTRRLWEAVSLPGAPSDLGELLVVDGTTAFLGTNAGILRSSDGASWASASATPVVGAPVHAADAIYWLSAGDGGVLRSGGDGTWTNIAPGGAVAPDAAALAVVGERRLVATGVGSTPQLIELSGPDGGGAWTAAPFGPALPYAPRGLVHRESTTFAVAPECASGQPPIADPVLSLGGP